mmetsp:Transcript_35939/g.75656  ORF Transcript_35939/g.75656 Transcript_35939/m.75656 type:complete len:209 (+) Transcript_35939:2019-2645(+)
MHSKEIAGIDVLFLIARQRNILWCFDLCECFPPTSVFPLSTLQRQVKLSKDLQLLLVYWSLRYRRSTARGSHEFRCIIADLARSVLLLLSSGHAPKPHRTEDGIASELLDQPIHPSFGVPTATNPVIERGDLIANNIENKAFKLEKGDRDGPCELVVLEADGDCFGGGAVVHVKKGGGYVTSEGISIEIKLIQIRVAVERRKFPSMRP